MLPRATIRRNRLELLPLRAVLNGERNRALAGSGGMNMAMTQTHGPVRQANEDNVKHIVDTTEARQGVVSGRVLSVLLISTILLAVIFAIIWLAGA